MLIKATTGSALTGSGQPGSAPGDDLRPVRPRRAGDLFRPRRAAPLPASRRPIPERDLNTDAMPYMVQFLLITLLAMLLSCALL
jgi:hypothetical protein